MPLSAFGGVLLTHFHSDHIGDLGELHLQTWANGQPAPLAVYGGPGVEQVVDGFNTAYRPDQGYRTAHHSERLMPSTTWGMVAHPVELDGAPAPAKDRYHLLPSPDGALPRSLFAQGVNEAREGDWTIADDGSLYTLPIGSNVVQIGRVR